MKSSNLRCGVFVSFLAVVILLVATANLNAQLFNPCGCEDVADLINQLNIANATYFELDQFEESLRQAIAPTVLTHGAALSGRLARLIAAIENKKAKAASAQTETRFCDAMIEAPTSCLKSVLKVREAVNEKFCQAAKDAERFKDYDRKNRFPMRTYINELRQAHQAEIAEIHRILRGLPPKCRPADWFGTITVVESIHNRTVIEKESAEDSTTRTGTIVFNGDNIPIKRSFWQVEGTFLNEKTGGGKRACTGGLRPGVADTAYTTSFTMEINKNGSTPDTTVVTIDEPDEDGRIAVGFRLSKVIAAATGQSRSVRTSGCPQDSFNITGPIDQPNYTFDSTPVAVTAKLTRKTKTDPDKIVGSETITLMSLTTDRATMFHTIKVNFQLYRL